LTAPGDLLHRLREEAEAADLRIRPLVRETPLEAAHQWSDAWGCTVSLKFEHHQRTGSFKLRGAVNRLLTVPASQRSLGVVTASTGNHGAAVACAAGQLGAPAIVYVPSSASASKVNGIRALGAEIRVHGEDGVDAEVAAREFAESSGRVYVSPYNDPQVIAGQATVGVELARQLARFDVVCVAVGGGGLIAGVAGYLRALHREVHVVGCSPAASPVMHASVEAGHQVAASVGPTLSDGTAGGLEPDTITFPLCRALVDEWVLVEEKEIAAALRDTLDTEHQLIEGAAAVAVAGARAIAGRHPRQHMVVVLCGGNIGMDVLRQAVCLAPDRSA